jgi:hypothetical protein
LVSSPTTTTPSGIAAAAAAASVFIVSFNPKAHALIRGDHPSVDRFTVAWVPTAVVPSPHHVARPELRQVANVVPDRR